MRKFLLLAMLTGCAGTQRQCQMGCASELGADWLVVQRGVNGEQLRCWVLDDVSIGDSEHVDGIYWDDDGDIVHITGWFDRVQVEGSWETAAATLDIDLSKCKR